MKYRLNGMTNGILIADSLGIKTIQSFHNFFHFTSCKLFGNYYLKLTDMPLISQLAIKSADIYTTPMKTAAKSSEKAGTDVSSKCGS
jgi:hypothetical protein